MIYASEEHRKALKEQPLLLFKRVPYLRNNLVRIKLPNQTERVQAV